MSYCDIVLFSSCSTVIIMNSAAHPPVHLLSALCHKLVTIPEFVQPWERLLSITTAAIYVMLCRGGAHSIAERTKWTGEYLTDRRRKTPVMWTWRWLTRGSHRWMVTVTINSPIGSSHAITLAYWLFAGKFMSRKERKCRGRVHWLMISSLDCLKRAL